MWHKKIASEQRSFALLLVLTLFTFTLWSGGVAAAGVGIYAGGHTTEGGMGRVDYNYSLELKDDKTYEIKSYFIMANELYDFSEIGAYSLDANKLVITPQGQDPIEGSVNADGSITIPIKPSPMAPRRTEATLQASANPVAGVYKASMQGATTVEFTLYLTHQGQYFYLAVPANDSAPVYETGFYQVQGTDLTFKIADSDDTFTGKATDGEIVAPFVVSAMMGMRMEIKLEAEAN